MDIFRPDGTVFEFNKDEFVDYFKADYFLEKPEKGFVCNIKNRSSKFIEQEIERVLKRGIETKQDVARLLAWKIGKIDHKKSEKSSSEEKVVFEYTDGWTNVEQRVCDNESSVKLRSKEEDFPIGKIASYILNDPDNLKQLAKENDTRSFFETFSKQPFKGLGTVYIFTLLYFLSGDERPIYDQFAHRAAKALVLDKNPKDVFVGYPPSKTETDKALGMYDEYCCLLSLLFGDSCIDRNQDRALWVYGHSKAKYPDCVTTE